MPMHAQKRKVALHEPSRLRVADPRSGPRLCEAQRFMAPTHVQSLEVFPSHEPRGTSNIEHRTPNTEHRTCNAEHRMASRILAHFGVRYSMLDVRCFPFPLSLTLTCPAP